MIRTSRVHRSWLGSGAVVLVLILAVAGFVCLLHDQDMGHQHLMTPDLCLGLLVVSLALVALVRPLVLGWTIALPPAPAYATTIHIPDPPPKLRSLS
jgi:hypothetical protein